MNYTYQDLAGMIDHSLLHPTMTDAELEAGCAVAAKYQVASVDQALCRQTCRRVAARERSASRLRRRVSARRATRRRSSDSKPRSRCRDGAVEIDMVVNIGKALSGDWDYAERDVQAVCDERIGMGRK